MEEQPWTDADIREYDYNHRPGVECALAAVFRRAEGDRM